MLTRIEIDGFKSYEDFALDLGPHVVILGANGVGKSNLFDALRFLSALAQHSVADAAKGLRGTPEQLFSFDGSGQPRATMTFAIEVLVEPTLEDPFENAVTLKNTRLRYELTLARRRNDSGFDEVLVEAEQLVPIARKDDRAFREASKDFRRVHLKYSQSAIRAPPRPPSACTRRARRGAPASSRPRRPTRPP